MIGLFCVVLAVLASPFKSKLRLEAENAVLRHQLIILRRRLRGRVRLTNHDRCSEIEHMRVQVGRQRREILQLQRAGIPTASAELLLTRMLAKIEGLCAERDRLKAEEGGDPTKGRVLGGRNW